MNANTQSPAPTTDSRRCGLHLSYLSIYPSIYPSIPEMRCSHLTMCYVPFTSSSDDDVGCWPLLQIGLATSESVSSSICICICIPASVSAFCVSSWRPSCISHSISPSVTAFFNLCTYRRRLCGYLCWDSVFHILIERVQIKYNLNIYYLCSSLASCICLGGSAVEVTIFNGGLNLDICMFRGKELLNLHTFFN